MEKIDFVELGQSFAVNCDKLRRGGERWEPGTTRLFFPKCTHRDRTVTTLQSRVSWRRSSQSEKHLSFLPGGWGERGILLCQEHALILNCVSWPEEDKCIQPNSSEGSRDVGKERKLPLWGKFPALMSSLGKGFVVGGACRPQRHKSGCELAGPRRAYFGKKGSLMLRAMAESLICVELIHFSNCSSLFMIGTYHKHCHRGGLNNWNLLSHRSLSNRSLPQACRCLSVSSFT